MPRAEQLFHPSIVGLQTSISYSSLGLQLPFWSLCHACYCVAATCGPLRRKLKLKLKRDVGPVVACDVVVLLLCDGDGDCDADDDAAPVGRQ